MFFLYRVVGRVRLIRKISFSFLFFLRVVTAISILFLFLILIEVNFAIRTTPCDGMQKRNVEISDCSILWNKSELKKKKNKRKCFFREKKWFRVYICPCNFLMIANFCSSIYWQIYGILDCNEINEKWKYSRVEF